MNFGKLFSARQIARKPKICFISLFHDEKVYEPICHDVQCQVPFKSQRPQQIDQYLLFSQNFQ